MWDEFFKWLIPFACGAVVSVFGALLTTLKKRNKHDKQLESAIHCLMRLRILDTFERWGNKNYCPTTEREALAKLFGLYKALGWNSVSDDLFHRIMTLPTTPPKEEDEE